MFIPFGEDFEVESDSVMSLEQYALRNILYRNYSTFKKAHVIYCEGHKTLLYHKMFAISEDDSDKIIELKNSSDKVVKTITQEQLTQARKRGDLMIVPQESKNQQLKLKLLFLKNILDNS